MGNLFSFSSKDKKSPSSIILESFKGVVRNDLLQMNEKYFNTEWDDTILQLKSSYSKYSFVSYFINHPEAHLIFRYASLQISPPEIEVKVNYNDNKIISFKCPTLDEIAQYYDKGPQNI